GLISPDLMTPLDGLWGPLGSAAVVIGISRYHMAPEVGPEHPYKDALRDHHRTWYWNSFWLILWMGYLLTVQGSAPPKWKLQADVTNFLAMACFTTAIRFQL